MFASVFVAILALCYCSKESNQSFLENPQLSGPLEALVKEIVEFKCELLTHPMNESILLQLFKKGNNTKLLGESTSLNGEPGEFNLVVKVYHEGHLECVASAQNDSNSDIEPTVSNTIYFKVIEPVKGATIVVRSGLVEYFEGQKMELFCNLTAGNHVSYMWLLNDQPISQSSGKLASDNRLLIDRTTSEDSGSYTCEATNHFNKTVFTNRSPKVDITVKELVSVPDISFTVLKEDSHNYSAMVTCQSTKGTLPVIFSLYNKTGLVDNMASEDRSAVFKVPLILDQNLGALQCQASNGDKVAHSQWLPLEVVSVGGPVTIQYEADVGDNFAVVALRFYCKVAKGSHPQYQWFLNKTLLHDRGSFYYVFNKPPGQSVLLLFVERISAGTYHCKVSDTFDNTTAISSKKTYLDKEVLNRLPIFVVAIVFGCFIFLILLICVCCGIGVVYRRKQYGEKSLSDLEMERMLASYEGELDPSQYNEDADGMKMTTGDEFDQASEASVDEWPQIAEEKKTLEDEPIRLP